MLKLFNFVFWYSLAVTAVFYVLPRVAICLQGEYESLNSATRGLMLAGMLLAVCVGLTRLVRSRNIYRHQSGSISEVTVRQFVANEGTDTRKMLH